MKYIICLSLLLTTTPVFAGDEWSTTDKVLVTALWTARMTDMLQTIEIYDNPDYDESGPVMKRIGEDGVVPFFVGTTILMHYAAHKLPAFRTPILLGATVGSLIPVIHNRNMGIKIRF